MDLETFTLDQIAGKCNASQSLKAHINGKNNSVLFNYLYDIELRIEQHISTPSPKAGVLDLTHDMYSAFSKEEREKIGIFAAGILQSKDADKQIKRLKIRAFLLNELSQDSRNRNTGDNLIAEYEDQH